MNDRRRDPGESTDQRPPGPTEDPERTEGLDPGAFIGHEPERMAETIPGGVGPADERISAVDTQSTGAGRPDRRGQPADEPGGHRDGPPASEEQRREAGDSPQ